MRFPQKPEILLDRLSFDEETSVTRKARKKVRGKIEIRHRVELLECSSTKAPQIALIARYVCFDLQERIGGRGTRE